MHGKVTIVPPVAGQQMASIYVMEKRGLGQEPQKREDKHLEK